MKFQRIVRFLKGVVQGPEAFKRAPQPTRSGKSHEVPDQHTELSICRSQYDWDEDWT
jgi:hypothetical protein